MKQIRYHDGPIGKIGVVEDEGVITHVYFEDELEDKVLEEGKSKLLKEACKQLEEYFQGVRKEFNLPLQPKGTPFMENVWKALQDIPYGETRSYKDIAEVVGNAKACRAVGLANNRNPIPIFIPCHRVVGANGKLIGYAGGLDIKTYLLELEKRY